MDFEKGTIRIEQQEQYQNGVIKLVPLKTHNARRTVYLCDKVKIFKPQIFEVELCYFFVVFFLPHQSTF